MTKPEKLLLGENYEETQLDTIWCGLKYLKNQSFMLFNFLSLVLPTNITQLQFTLTVTDIELAEEERTFIVSGWTKIMWLDERLKWNPSDFDGATIIRVMMHEIW